MLQVHSGSCSDRGSQKKRMSLAETGQVLPPLKVELVEASLATVTVQLSGLYRE